MKNKLLNIFIFLVMLVFSLKAQTQSEKEIIGTWKVAQVHLLIDKVEPDQKEKLDLLKNAFLKSTFVFKADKNFSFDFEFKEMAVKKGHWKYNNETNSFIVQDWKDKNTDNNNLLVVTVKKEKGKTMFLIPDTFFQLEMKKL